MFKYFFLSKDNLPKNIGFVLYDKYHITWLCLILLFILIISIRYKSMTYKKKELTRKICGSLILSTEIYYQTILIITKQFNINYLPLHLCGIAIFLCFYDSLHPNDIVREFLYCLCMPGALMALLFPNWTAYPLLNFANINSFILHGLLICYPIMIMCSKEFIPDYKRLPTCAFLLVAISTPIYFFNKIFNTNFLFLNTPSQGSPLVILEDWLGNPGYILGMLIMVFVCWIILYIPIIIKNLHIKKRNLLEA